jgi:hypothetical protein
VAGNELKVFEADGLVLGELDAELAYVISGNDVFM